MLEHAADPAATASVQRVGPYGDRTGDGLVQMAFTLPVEPTRAGRRAAVDLVEAMGLADPHVVHAESLTEGYTYFILYALCGQTVAYDPSQDQRSADEQLTLPEIDALIDEHLDRPLVVVGASTGSDTHTVGIDAILNLKGYDGHHGLEAYRGFRAYNMGSQVSNGDLIAKALEVEADAILVSQTVTQQGLHVGNLTQLVDMIEAEGLRERVVLCCGGPLITDELAKELGYDAGFSKGTYPHHVAAYLARTAIERAESGVAAG
ncbi:MAG TPA: OAM dimerization domain-containing protein [Baekduia sp.]